MSLTEKFDKKAYPVLLAEMVLMAAAIQINIFFEGGIANKILFGITLGIIVAIFFVDCYKLYPFVGVLIVLAGAFVIWQREAVWPILESSIKLRVIGIILLAAIALYISQHFFVMRLSVCIGYWGSMIFLIYKDLFPVKQVMFFLVAELVFVLAECYDRACYKKEANRNKKMFYLWPAVLILVLVIACMPYKKEPLSWSRTKKLVHTIANKLEIFVDNLRYWGEGLNEFGLGFTGYTEQTDFFGNKIDSDGDALDLTMVGNSEHIYLVGNIKNEYTGDGWSGNPQSSKSYGDYKEYQLDAAEYLYMLYRAEILGTRDIEWYVHFRRMAVKYNGVHTSSLFRPGKTITINDVENRGQLLDEADNVSFSRNQSNKTSYDLEFFAINRSFDQAENLIKEQSAYKYTSLIGIEYENFRRLVHRKYTDIELPEMGDFEKLLARRAEYIRETYTGIPESVTKRTQQLADVITRNYTTDYEKMDAIIRYLSDYEYTVTPGRPPEGQDIADYFLFESKQGYCTHFATAAAVLARCAGIPVRYVQGYLLDYNLIEPYGKYTVKDSQAHAWIECYFEGVGWLTYEPTPGNNGYLYQEWDIPSFVTGEDKEEDDKPIAILPSEDEEEEPEELPEEILPGSDVPDEMQNSLSMYLYIVISIAVCAIAWLIYLKVCELRFWSYYRKASYGRKVSLDVLMILWMMQNAGYPMHNTETIREYFKRLCKRYPDKVTVFMNVCNIYMRIRYSNKKDSTKEEHHSAQRLRLSFMDKSINEGAMARQCFKMIRHKKV